jgi:hypothetical protein
MSGGGGGGKCIFHNDLLENPQNKRLQNFLQKQGTGGWGEPPPPLLGSKGLIYGRDISAELLHKCKIFLHKCKIFLHKCRTSAQISRP